MINMKHNRAVYAYKSSEYLLNLSITAATIVIGALLTFCILVIPKLVLW